MLGRCAQGVTAGAAAGHFVEGLAEVSEAGIADFEAGLGDVAFAGAQEVGGALEAGAAELLGEGEAGLAGGGAAEVEVAAGDAAAKVFEGGVSARLSRRMALTRATRSAASLWARVQPLNRGVAESRIGISLASPGKDRLGIL